MRAIIRVLEVLGSDRGVGRTQGLRVQELGNEGKVAEKPRRENIRLLEQLQREWAWVVEGMR